MKLKVWKCFVIGFVFLLIYPHLTYSACTKSSIPTSGSTTTQPSYYRCTLDSEKPVTGLHKGDFAYSEDTFSLHIATDTTTWLIVNNPTSLVNSVSNSDGSLTVAPTTGNVIALLNVGHSNSWTALQKFRDNSLFQLLNTSDITKIAQFDLANIATGTVRIVNIPNANSTTAQAITAVANNYITSMSVQGVFTQSRPSCATLSDSGPGCSSAAGGVTSVTNTDNSLTITPTTGAVNAKINTGNSNTWTVQQNISLNATVSPVSSDTEAPLVPNTVLLNLAGDNSHNSFVTWNSWNGSSAFLGITASGTALSPGAIAANFPIFSIIGQGHDGVAYSGNQGAFRIKTFSLWSGSDHNTQVCAFTTPVGSTAMAQAGCFTPSGGLHVGTALVNTAAGIINAHIGYTIGEAAAIAGNVLRGDGTKFIAGQLGITDLSAFSSADLAARLTDENGTGTVVYSIGAGLSSVTPFSLRDSSAAFNVTITPTSSPVLSANRTLTINMGDKAHTINLGVTAGSITFPNTSNDTVAMLGIANSFGVGQVINTTSGAGLTINLGTIGSISTTDSGGTTFITSHIRPSAGKDGWLSFAEDTVADRWSVGIINADSKLYFKSGLGAGATTQATLSNAGVFNAISHNVNGQILSTIVTGTEQALGDVTSTLRLRSTLTTPTSLANGDVWWECTGTSPTRICATKVRDGGATRTIASVTY